MHFRSFLKGLCAVTTVSIASADLDGYDSKIASDNAKGLTVLSQTTEAYDFDTTNNQPFDFGAVSDSATFEFIVGGDPEGGGRNGFLGEGSDTTFSLRYEQWDDTGRLGFTHRGVVDYVFEAPGTPPPPPPPAELSSPTELTHVTYRWDSTTSTMELYINGELTGTAVADGYMFPSGEGFLGNNAGSTEGMIGTMERVTVYASSLSPEEILAHAEAWNGDDGSLAKYDELIENENSNGLPYSGASNATLTFDSTGNEPFNFGNITDSATIEFIVSGDPVNGPNSAFLGVGSDPTFSLRYEQWQDSGLLGFTHGGVADYTFDPIAVETVPTGSPVETTHITYRWDAPASTMELFVNGELTGRTVAEGFIFPFGEGYLGNQETGASGMIGTIERATVYAQALTDENIAAHADAWNPENPSLNDYDALIISDNSSDLPFSNAINTPVIFDSTNNVSFDFGDIPGSATMEFILSGDPASGPAASILAVGSDPVYTLRYEQWQDTNELGFTHGGVADYLFDDPAAVDPPDTTSPTELTHVVYRWDQDTTTMELYLDGVLAGVNSAATGFVMPSGQGLLGNNAGLGEGMLGQIARVTIYNDAISPEDIAAHASAWLAPAGGGLAITNVDYSLDTGLDSATVVLTFNSRANANYAVYYSTDLKDWIELSDNETSEGDTTTYTDVISDASTTPKRFYYVEEL